MPRDVRRGAPGAHRGTARGSGACAARLPLAGFVEAVTWSFIPPDQAKLFGGGAAELTLSNPISTELAVMRPGLLPGLVDRGAAEPRPWA